MFRRLHQLFLRWNQDDAGLMSAAVAYYAVLSMFPLLLILTSGLGVFLKWTNEGQDAQHYIFTAIGEQVSPALAENVQMALNQVQQQASFSGPVGFVTLLIASMALFAQFERAFDRIWNVNTPRSVTFWQTAKRVITHRLRAFLMLICLGIAIVAVFFAGLAFQAFRAFTGRHIETDVSVWWFAQILLVVVLNALVFSLLYKFLPKAKVRWIHALRGGIFAAICWEFGRQVLAAFVIGKRYSAYGLIGSLLAIMLWAYYSFAIIFVGAEYAQLLGEEESQPTTSDKSNDAKPKKSFPGEATAMLLLAYFGLFLAARHFNAHEISPSQQNAPVVVFSQTSDGQQWAKLLFAPLIASLPGHYQYPDASELPDVLSKIHAQKTSGAVRR